MNTIRKSTDADFAPILSIINDAAQVYRGVIPEDRWHEPYMPAHSLAREIADGLTFWVAEEDGVVAGVMGIQDKGDVALVRHADEKDRLLRTYWSIPPRQIETSVMLANEGWPVTSAPGNALHR
ncbi:MAG: hypothetical protein ACT4PJ_03845 [Gemmatimonadaceae bacterium]